MRKLIGIVSLALIIACGKEEYLDTPAKKEQLKEEEKSKKSGPILARIKPNNSIFIDTILKKSFKRTIFKKVYRKLLRNKDFYNRLKPFIPSVPVLHLEFSVEKLDKNTNAETRKPNAKNEFEEIINPNKFIIQIVFNSYNADRSDVLIARDMVHEMIHAGIFRQMNPYFNSDRTINYDKLENSGFPGLFDYYDRYRGKDPQHNLMAVHYIDAIISIISDFDKHREDLEVYEALAWLGLEGTEAWRKLSEGEQSWIKTLRRDFERRRSKRTPEYNLDPIELKSPAKKRKSVDKSNSRIDINGGSGSSSTYRIRKGDCDDLLEFILGRKYEQIESDSHQIRYFNPDSDKNRKCLEYFKSDKKHGRYLLAFEDYYFHYVGLDLDGQWVLPSPKKRQKKKVGTVTGGPIQEEPMCSYCTYEPLSP